MHQADCQIERGPYGAWLTIAVAADSQEIPYQLETLIASRPKALLPVFRQVVSSGARYAYPVTGLATLSELVAKKRFRGSQADAIAHQVSQLIGDLPDCLLSPQQLLLHPDQVFIQLPEWEVRAVYQPFLPLSQSFGEKDLLEWLDRSSSRTFRFPHPRDWGVTAGVFSTGLAIVQVIALGITLVSLYSPPEWPIVLDRIALPLLLFFSLTVPLQALLLLRTGSRMTVRENQASRSVAKSTEHKEKSVIIQAGESLKRITNRMNPRQLMDHVKESVLKRVEKSEVNLGQVREMPTELLSSKQALFRLATLSEGMIGTPEENAGQRAFILTEEFVVGRDFRQVDLCLTGFAVGRRHARISRKGATFFITDLGSKNGTRLNGEPLGKHVEYRLPDRCQLQFADRLFYFEAEELHGSSTSQ